MKTVYCVQSRPIKSALLHCVFSSRKKAEEHAARMPVEAWAVQP